MKLVDKKIKHIYEAGINNMVTLVSTRVNGRNFVMTSSTVTEVSHDPPILAVSICPERYTYGRILERGAFVVNILSIKQKSLAKACGTCSGRNISKFENFRINFTLNDDGLPFIENCLANIACKLIATHRYGDHSIFVGEMYEARVYGEREVRHLLLSDVKTWIPPGMPQALYYFIKRFSIVYKIRDLTRRGVDALMRQHH